MSKNTNNVKEVIVIHIERSQKNVEIAFASCVEITQTMYNKDYDKTAFEKQARIMFNV